MTTLRLRDDRKTHLLTRGNVDGIVSAALFLAKDPSTKVTFVPSGDLAVDHLRRDLSSSRFYLVDLGLTPKLLRALNNKAKTSQMVSFLDHHQQSAHHLPELDKRVERSVVQGQSAAGVAYDYLNLNGLHRKLVAIADKVEYCFSKRLESVERDVGRERLEHEAQALDFAWRKRVDDDLFRLQAARRLASGCWPTEVPEVRARYLQMVNENRWERALVRVRNRVSMNGRVAVLRFGRRKPSLFGFGTRALSAVAREMEADVAIMMNRRNRISSLSLRRTSLVPSEGMDLGLFVDDFTTHHGIVGGGHPNSAGAKIPTRRVPDFMKELYTLA